MSALEPFAVLSCVAALCSSYGDARKLVHQLRIRWQERRPLRDPEVMQADTLANTLDKGNEVVRAQYDHTLMQVGSPFASGDQEACSQLKDIIISLRVQIIQNLKLAWQQDQVVDFYVLQQRSNEAKDRAVLCLLQLHQRLLIGLSIEKLSPAVTHEVYRKPSGYIEPASPPQAFHAISDPPETQSNYLDLRNMQRFPSASSTSISPPSNGPPKLPPITALPTPPSSATPKLPPITALPTPPPTSALPTPPPSTPLPTPPPSASTSRRNTAGSEAGAKKRSPLFGFGRSGKASTEEQMPMPRPSTGRADSFRESEHALQVTTSLPLRESAVTTAEPVTRQHSKAESYATTTSNEHVELIANPWNETSTIAPPHTFAISASPRIKPASLSNSYSPQLQQQSSFTQSPPSGASSIYSTQRSMSIISGIDQRDSEKNSSFIVPGADQREFLPSEKNKFQGLCKSAWRLQTGQQKKAMKARERLVSSYGKQTIPYWSCSNCDFEGKLIKVGKEERLDSTILEVPVANADGHIFAIRWRWTFLFRSHFPMKSASGWDSHKTVQQRAIFGCMFCCAQGKPVPGLTGVKNLIDHLANEHVGRGRWPRDEVLYRMNCVVGERAPVTAHWDLNLVEVQ